jgi:pimeloyl-ACP methyl ester carboxylesterase
MIETHLSDFAETAEALGIGSATWVGHSYGGRLAGALSASRPELVERAVLLYPAMHIDPPSRPSVRTPSALSPKSAGRR